MLIQLYRSAMRVQYGQCLCCSWRVLRSALQKLGCPTVRKSCGAGGRFRTMSINTVRGFLRVLAPSKQISPLAGVFGVQDSLGPWHQQLRGYPSQKHQKLILEAQKRNRARKLQKQEEIKIDFVTAQKTAALKKTSLKSKRYNPGDNLPPKPHDDVYLRSWYREANYSLEECILMHRELMHPTMLGREDNIIVASVELNMHAKKKNKYLEGFQGTLIYPHAFPNKSRITKILCFCQSGEEATLLMENGADLAGGAALVKKVASGEVDFSVYDHVLTSVDMVDEIQALKSILRKKMPSTRKTISADLLTMVKGYRKSVIYEVKRDIYEPDYAQVSVPLARLDMPLDHIEDNLKLLFIEVNEHMPAGRPMNSFISQVFLSSPPSPERFVLNKEPYEKYVAETLSVEMAATKGRGKTKTTIVEQKDVKEEEGEGEEAAADADKNEDGPEKVSRTA
ncbi:39S ribosomal protein L1 [Tropilaelaps mercedesae]|uniref:39S ribosomal protein L1 n=1 Tax=Tropilaelaps mercedesae TaxID=418985 RepID=A0A1V9XPW5_9ACAR|nr:39S ribosomal protein L1 [Tropilaelaps mercedesae]